METNSGGEEFDKSSIKRTVKLEDHGGKDEVATANV